MQNLAQSASEAAFPNSADPAIGKDGEVKVQALDYSNKIIAAALGSLLTALTMTPFDVVKTRIQTQPAALPLFQPVDHLPVASSSKVRIEALPKLHPASTSATCCQPTTFFGCKFDSRGMSTLGTDAVHVESLPRGTMASFAPVGRADAFSLIDAEAACAYPDVHTARESLKQDPRRLNGMLDAVVKIVRHEGPGALWRGTGPALVMSMPAAAAYMVGYDKLRARLLAGSSPFDVYYRGGATLFAGALARTLVVTAASPLELLRTRLQSENVHFREVFRSYRQLVNQQGVTALWRGLPPTLWRDVPFSGIYWASYELVRRRITGGRGFGEMQQGESRSSAFTTAFTSGAISGSIAATLTNPFDVIKTRRQATSDPAHARTATLLSNLLRDEGLKGLLSGLTPRLAKVAPACGIMISVYEAAAHFSTIE